MEPLLNKLISYLHNGFEFLILSFLITAVTFLVPGERKNAKYAISAVILGTVFGLTAKYTPGLEAFQFIASILGAAVGPKTLASMQGKTLRDILREYIDKKDDDGAKE